VASSFQHCIESTKKHSVDIFVKDFCHLCSEFDHYASFLALKMTNQKFMMTQIRTNAIRNQYKDAQKDEDEPITND
jgi:hypothetical protein